MAGASSTDYSLPSQSTATPKSVISLKDGHSHGDIMTAENTVTMEADETNTLDMKLERRVMNIRNVSVENVPDGVKSVTVTLSPLYSEMRLNGSFKNEDDVQTVKLTKDADDNGLWANSNAGYMYPASGKATVKVSMTTADGDKESFSYTCDSKLEANYRVDIKGTYKSGSITLSGTLTGAVWAGSQEIEFTGGSVDGGQNVEGDAPEAGTVYKGCYVLTSEKSESGKTTRVVLLSPSYNDTWTFTSGDIEKMKSEINSKLEELAVKGISGWRLPTQEEITYALKNNGAINDNIKNSKESSKPANVFAGTYGYFFNNGTEIGLLKYSSSTVHITAQEDIGAGKSTILRAFATLIYQ